MEFKHNDTYGDAQSKSPTIDNPFYTPTDDTAKTVFMPIKTCPEDD